MGLREAAQQALEALEDSHQNINPERRYADELTRQIADSITALRAALAEDAMQHLTDVQQEMEPVTNCHEKEGDKLAPPLDVPETNFGNIAQSVDSTEADHIPDATKMIEPVAYVTGYSKGYATVRPVDPCLLMCVGMA